MHHFTTYINIKVRAPLIGGVYRRTKRKWNKIKIFFFPLLLLILIIVLAFAFVPRTRAEVILTPHTCLGGWNNSSNASGPPEVGDGDSSKYSDNNSASVSNTLADIFCGDFSGDIPKDTKPTAITVKFSWALVPKQASVEISTSPADLASSTGAVLDASSESVGVDGLASTTVATDTVPIETMPVDTPFASSTQISPPLHSAQDASSTDATTDVHSPVIPSTDSPQSSAFQKIISFVMPSVAHAQEVVTDSTSSTTFTTSTSLQATTSLVEASSTDSTLATSSAPNVEPIVEDAVLEVSYTLDGSTWHVLRTVNPSEFSSTSFTIPVYAVPGWNDLAHLQIRVRTLSMIGNIGTVYLDGMTLSVEYAADVATPVEEIASSTLKLSAGVVDRGLAPQGEYVNISGANPGLYFELYWLDDPDTQPEASNEYATTISNDGTVAIDTGTLPLGRHVLVAITYSDQCGGLSLEECRVSTGYLGEIPLMVSAPVVQ
jgi:hypothetical protein